MAGAWSCVVRLDARVVGGVLACVLLVCRRVFCSCVFSGVFCGFGFCVFSCVFSCVVSCVLMDFRLPS